MRDLASELGVSHNAINIWENEESNISDNNLTKLSHLLGLEKEYLYKKEFTSKEKMIIELARSKYKGEIISKEEILNDNDLKHYTDTIRNNMKEHYENILKEKDKEIEKLKYALETIQTIINTNL